MDDDRYDIYDDMYDDEYDDSLYYDNLYDDLTNWDNLTIDYKLNLIKNVKTLNLALRGLKSLPDSIGNLVNLKELYINNNQLISLPLSIGIYII